MAKEEKGRKIIHVDMDCFYAQVEMLERPELRSVPLGIGGPPGTRSVLCTSNYLARTFGVKSAMPSDYAVKLCPQLVILPPQFKKYKEASLKIHNVFARYSQQVESVSLDEAYLDVSFSENATAIGHMIKKDILAETGLVASVGIAPNKFLAKVASDWKKPNGFFVIRPHEVEQFMKDLPVKVIPGVGKMGLQNLESLGIKTCQHLREFPPEVMILTFGKSGLDFLNFARGIDRREVQSEWERKSLSVESTFLKDLNDFEEMKFHLNDLIEEMKERLERHLAREPHKKVKKIFVKIKYADFKQSCTEETLDLFHRERPFYERSLTLASYTRLLEGGLAKRRAPVRLLGVGVRFLTSEECDPYQLSFFPLCA